jgi:hypothetical protein
MFTYSGWMREIGHRDADRVGDGRHREVDLGGEDHEGQAHRDDAGDRRLAEDVQRCRVTGSWATAGEAEEDHQRDEREHRRDVAQLVRHEPLEVEAPWRRFGLPCHRSQSPMLSHARRRADRPFRYARAEFLRHRARASCTVTRSASVRMVSGSVDSTRMATPLSRSVLTMRITSSLAPTSMPRVGSDRISTLRQMRQPFGQRHLLLVAARQRAERECRCAAA